MVKREAASVILAVEELLGHKIRVKKKELARWQLQKEQAAHNEERCVREISEMEMAIAVFKRAIGVEAETPSTDEMDDLRFRTQTVAQSCIDIMSKAGGRARVTHILKRLMRAGKLKSYQSGYATITKTLDRDERFRKVARGEFELVESPDESL